MKVTLESTTRIVDAGGVQARVWEGETARGVRVYALIPRISAHRDDDLSQFEAELLEQRAPSDAAAECFPLRMIL